MFTTDWFSRVFALTMRTMAAPLYKWPIESLHGDMAAATDVCDVGAGNGNFLWHNARNFVGKNLTLVDRSASQLAAGQRNVVDLQVRHEVTRVVAPAEKLPFEDGAFDLVVSTGSINLWESPMAGLSECGRVLRPSGALWILDQMPCATFADAWDALVTKRMFGLGLPGYTCDDIVTFASGVKSLGEALVVETDHSFYAIKWVKADVGGVARA